MISVSGVWKIVSIAAAGVVSVGGVVAISTGGPTSSNQGAAISCDQTLSSGGNVATALTALTAGGTLCLNPGSYTYNASVSKTAQTTVTAANGDDTSVTFTSWITNTSNHLTFDHITLNSDSSEIGDGNPADTGSTHLYLTNSRVIRPGSLCIQMLGPSNADILINNVDFGNTQAQTTGDTNCDGGEGRLDIKSECTTCGIVVENSNFGPNGDGDAIQVHFGTDGVQIGPGNYFHDIIEDRDCSTTHCDAIQPFGAHHLTITGNYFYNTSDGIQAPDCAGGNDPSPLTITNNVFEQEGTSQTQEVNLSGLFGGTSSNVITHNTFEGSFQLYGGNDACTNDPITLRDNVFDMTATGCTISSTSAGSIIDHNLMSGSNTCNGGTGSINGTPTFVGGTLPTTLAGWALTSGSSGHAAASDGTDMGAPVATMTGAWP